MLGLFACILQAVQITGPLTMAMFAVKKKLPLYDLILESDSAGFVTLYLTETNWTCM